MATKLKICFWLCKTPAPEQIHGPESQRATTHLVLFLFGQNISLADEKYKSKIECGGKNRKGLQQ